MTEHVTWCPVRRSRSCGPVITHVAQPHGTIGYGMVTSLGPLAARASDATTAQAFRGIGGPEHG